MRRVTADRATTRGYAVALDAADSLGHLRDQFVIADGDLIYLDGNSLGRLPKATVAAMAEMVTNAWGGGLVRSWREWIGLSSALCDRLAEQVLGAGPGEVVVAASASVNLYKLAWAALDACPERETIVVAPDDFPTNRCIMQGLARNGGHKLRELRDTPYREPSLDRIRSAVDGDVALLVLSLVSYHSGELLDMAAVNEIARRAGPGCCGISATPPGSCRSSSPLPAPNSRSGAPTSTSTLARARPRSPIWHGACRVRCGSRSGGGSGSAGSSTWARATTPAPTVAQLLVGTPSVLAMWPLGPALEILAEAGVAAVRKKAIRQGELMVHLADEWLAPLGFQLASPRDPALRGAHVSLAHRDAWRIFQSLALRSVVADFRAPDLLPFADAPLYTRHSEIWDAMDRLRRLVGDGLHEKVPPERVPAAPPVHAGPGDGDSGSHLPYVHSSFAQSRACAGQQVQRIGAHMDGGATPIYQGEGL